MRGELRWLVLIQTLRTLAVLTIIGFMVFGIVTFLAWDSVQPPADLALLQVHEQRRAALDELRTQMLAACPPGGSWESWRRSSPRGAVSNETAGTLRSLLAEVGAVSGGCKRQAEGSEVWITFFDAWRGEESKGLLWLSDPPRHRIVESTDDEQSEATGTSIVPIEQGWYVFRYSSP